MGQTVDGGLQYLNVSDRYKQGQDIGAASAFDVEKNKSGQAAGITEELISGYKYEKGNSQVVSSTMDNFEEFLKNRQEKAKEAGEDARSERREAKEDAKEISRRLSSEEIQKLQMMGIDVTSAKLSDLMGIVNTMRGEAHREELAKVLAGVAAGNGDVSRLTVMGGTAKVIGSDVEIDGVSASDVILARENQIIDSGKTVAAEKDENMSENFQMTNRELVYIIKNNIQLTKDNMYKAHFSGSAVSKEGVSEELFNQMKSQIDKVIDQAGLYGDEEALKGAKFLLDNNLPVTTDNIRTFVNYQKLQGKSVAEADFPMMDEGAVEAKAKDMVKSVATFDIANLYHMVKEGREVTIASISSYQKNTQGEPGKDDKDLKTVTAMRQMEELRLYMTMEAATKLVKSDFNIDTRELSKVVSKLKDMEDMLIKNQLKQAEVEPTKDNVDLYKEISTKVAGLADGHAGILASPLKGMDFSVNTLYGEKLDFAENGAETGYETVRREKGYNSFEAATRSYEAVGTAPRADMGDSITKAFANIRDILTEMNLSVNYENERAVRILGYNSLEITPDNIASVVGYDRQVNQLMDTFYPEAVLSMIKDGINPLDVPIDELNQVIKDRNYNQGVTEAENFATYLRDMEKQGLVSPEERESYIGIYRVMDKLAKSKDREAGWIFNSGAELTVRNLITAMRSRKASGIDVSLGDELGMLENVTTKGKDMEKQIGAAFDNREEIKNLMEKMAEASDEVYKFLADRSVEATGVNVAAAEAMISNPGGLYNLVSDILAKMKFKTTVKEELVDEETENMSDSMSGEDVSIPFMPENILESLKGSEEMSLKYEDLRNQLTELMYDAGIAGTISSMDISAIKTVSAGFNIMSNMAKNNRFQLPVETETGIRVVNLTIAKGEGESGTIDISMGDISAKIKVGRDNELTGYIVSATSEGNYELQHKAADFKTGIAAGGFRAEKITIGSISSIDTDYMVEDTRDLYDASVALVKAMSGFVG